VLLELLSPERITAAGAVAIGLLTAWMSRQASKVKILEGQVAELKAQRVKDQGVVKAAMRHIRDWVTYGAVLVGLIQSHAPGVIVPSAPALPDELKDEI
jgi:hypothetical protein